MERFIGKWKDNAGNILDIKPNDGKSLKVSFYSGLTGKPIQRDYFDNKLSVNMNAELDYYETSLEVDLWTKEKGFILILLYDWNELKNEPNCYCLSPGLSNFIEDDYANKYGHLFYPKGTFKRMD